MVIPRGRNVSLVSRNRMLWEHHERETMSQKKKFKLEERHKRDYSKKAKTILIKTMCAF